MQIGGGNLVEKLPALKFLASVCDGLVFVGMMSFQIMHALGLSIPLNLLEGGSAKEALELIKVAKARNASILCPKDFWCMRNNLQTQLKVLPFHGISEGKSLSMEQREQSCSLLSLYVTFILLVSYKIYPRITIFLLICSTLFSHWGCYLKNMVTVEWNRDLKDVAIMEIVITFGY